MVTFLVLFIILIPVCFLIYKKTVKAWNKVGKEEQEEQLDEKIDEAKQVDKLYRKADRVDVERVKKQKEKIDKVKKS